MSWSRAVLRAIHFINENKRVGKQAEALKSEKIDEFLTLIKESGDSYVPSIFRMFIR